MEWVTPAATVALVGVTIWYAISTQGMAKSARDSAADSAKATAAAERAAEAAKSAAQVAQSQIRVEFTGRTVAAHIGGGEDGDDWVNAILVQSIADAVVVKEVRVRRAFRESHRALLSPEAELIGEVLEPFNEESRLPRRLHADEDLVLSHGELQDEGVDPFDRFIIDVDYTFAENGATGGTRRLVIDR